MIADGKVVLELLAAAAYVYLIASIFVSRKLQPKKKPSAQQIVISLAWLACGLVVAVLLIYVWHMSPYVVTAIAIIGSLVSVFIERKRALPN